MEIGVQRDDDALLLASKLNDGNILRLGHAAFADVLHVPANLPQQACRRAR